MKKAYLTFIFLILLSGVLFSQYFSDQAEVKKPSSEPIVLNSEIVKIIDLGLHNAASDIAWLGAIQYFGGRTTNNSPKLNDYLVLSTDLDPKFSYPYAFGTLILPSIGKVDKGIELAKKGIDEAEDWRIPYYLATTYHIFKNDSQNAAYYFDVAASTKGAPENIARIAARYGTGKDKRDQTKQIWIGIFESSNDEVVRERAKKYVMHYEIMDFLEEAAGKYKEKFGKFPTDINELVTGKILKEIPPDPFGFTFSIDENGKLVLK